MRIVHACAAEAVERVFTKVSDFADEVGKSTTEVGLRLRRGIDSNGDLKVAYLDYLGIIAHRPGGKFAFITALAREWGFRVEPIRALTDEERADILGAALTPEAKRALERERGLPLGSLG